MYGYIYQTINNINGKKYIGKHVAKEFEPDKYLGSGKILRAAINKYGKENFSCQLLCECYSDQELNEKEKYYINKFDAIKSNNFYNIALGGEGGNTVAGLTTEEYEHFCKACACPGNKNGRYKKEVSSDTRAKISKANKNRKQSVEQRIATSKRNKGCHWYNNGQTNIYAKTCPYGFIKGRLVSEKQLESYGKVSQQFKNTHYFNNGIIEIRTHICPDGFSYGRLLKNSQSNRSAIYIYTFDNIDFLTGKELVAYLKLRWPNFSISALTKIRKNSYTKCIQNKFQYIIDNLSWRLKSNEN